MNALRLVINVLLTLVCAAGGLHLLSRPVFLLPDRQQPTIGTVFAGPSLHLLALSVLLLAVLAAAVLVDWMRGAVPMPPGGQLHPHLFDKGRLLLRYRPLISAACCAFPWRFSWRSGGRLLLCRRG